MQVCGGLLHGPLHQIQASLSSAAPAAQMTKMSCHDTTVCVAVCDEAVVFVTSVHAGAAIMAWHYFDRMHCTHLVQLPRCFTLHVPCLPSPLHSTDDRCTLDGSFLTCDCPFA